MKKLILSICFLILGLSGFSQAKLQGKWLINAGRTEFDIIIDKDVPCPVDSLLYRADFLGSAITIAVHITLSSQQIPGLTVSLKSDSIIYIKNFPYEIPSYEYFEVASTRSLYNSIFFGYSSTAENNYDLTPAICSFPNEIRPTRYNPLRSKLPVNKIINPDFDYSMVIWPYFWVYNKYSGWTHVVISAVYAVYDAKTGKLILNEFVEYKSKKEKVLSYNASVNALALQIVESLKKISK